jgi:hypothetical protein
MSLESNRQRLCKPGEDRRDAEKERQWRSPNKRAEEVGQDLRAEIKPVQNREEGDGKKNTAWVWQARTAKLKEQNGKH